MTTFKHAKFFLKGEGETEWQQLQTDAQPSTPPLQAPELMLTLTYINPAVERMLPAMPSASDAEHDQMRKWFGEMPHGTDCAATEYLEAHGYTLRRDWHWELPTPAHTVNCFEHRMVIFLINEWDFGGIKVDNSTFRCVCGSCKVQP